MKTIKFYTLGCKVNQYETQSIREKFLRSGFRELGNGKPADTYLINTCTVTHNADSDSRHYIRKARKENPRARIIVTGCLVEKDAGSLAELEEVDFIIGKRFFADEISSFCGHTRAFLKIQDGCDNFCSYCKVPLVRGRSRSKKLAQVIKEAKALVKNGFKEIVLCGICLGAYGKDLRQHSSLVDAIGALEKINGLLRIRLSSIEAGDVTDGLIRHMAHSKKLCRHLHIPIQSGDDEILKKMGRKYSAGEYLKLINKIKKSVWEVSITTDLLVGFPGEGEENFKHTISLVKKIMPLRVHAFAYSQRPGTKAADFKDKPAPLVVKQRMRRLRKMAELASLKYRRRFLNKKMPVLIESRLKVNCAYWQGHTDNYIEVWVRSGRDLRNRLINVKFRKITGDAVLADIC